MRSLPLITLELRRHCGEGYKVLRSQSARETPADCGQPRSSAMDVGTVFLVALITGVITQAELQWLTTHQDDFNRVEEATALRLGRLLDTGSIQLGCRLPG
jgi:hypothetical protein